jgi:CheY-like chemotaxis protein
LPTILVVDVAEDIRDVARVSLERLGGWDVLTAASGPEALAVAERHRLDAVLLDLSMPGIGGLETLRLLRAREPAALPPVILLTAGPVAPHGAELARLGVAGVLPKPFDPLLLPRQVTSILASD